jgi:hypothetical protein
MDRETYRARFTQCMMCGEPGTDVHEMARGPFRSHALDEPCAWLKLCRACHEEIDGLPVLLQLAIKFLSDPRNFDVRRLNKIRRRAENAITPHEVYMVAAVLVAYDPERATELAKRLAGLDGTSSDIPKNITEEHLNYLRGEWSAKLQFRNVGW